MGYASRPESGTLRCCMTSSSSKTMSAVIMNPAFFFYTHKNPVTGEDSMIAVYVDDLVLRSNLPSVITDLKASFASKFKITDLGPLDQILGI
mmetsp:Transcript_39853/g.68759  ORF Transcript_39853/g.68759 Transcript_39853/m.68759 type:complete len:92 (-) Transcript_39853:412-687(-)